MKKLCHMLSLCVLGVAMGSGYAGTACNSQGTADCSQLDQDACNKSMTVDFVQSLNYNCVWYQKDKKHWACKKDSNTCASFSKQKHNKKVKSKAYQNQDPFKKDALNKIKGN